MCRSRRKLACMAEIQKCRECGTAIDETLRHGECPGCGSSLPLAGGPSVRAGRRDAGPGLEELARRLPEFEICELLGRGGMGAVYRGRQKTLDRDVAIKVLTVDGDHEAHADERFIREAQLLARLHHPNIVAAYDAGEVDGLPYLVMQYVEGGSLNSQIRKHGPASVPQAVDWVLQAACGLEYAHRKGV